MSIGGNPAVAGSITLDNTVEHAQWKTSANATPQDVTTIRLNGTSIWTKPDLQIVQNTPTYNTETEKVTISVTRPTLINSWKYKINSGSLSSAQTSNSIAVSRSSFTNNSNNTITVYGYRDGVLKGNSVAKTIYVAQDNTLSGSASWNRNNNSASLSVTLGSSLTGWTYQVGSGSQINGSGTTATITDTSNGAKTVTFRGFLNNTQKNSTTASYTVAVPSISCTATGGEEKITISISRSNHISTDKWQYKIDSGSWQTGAAIGTTSKVVTGVAAGTRSVQVRLQNSGGTVLATSASVSTTVQAAYVPPTAGSSATATNSSGDWIKHAYTTYNAIKTNEISLNGIGDSSVEQLITIKWEHWFGDTHGFNDDDDYSNWRVNSATATRTYSSPKGQSYYTPNLNSIVHDTNQGVNIAGPLRNDDDDGRPLGDAGILNTRRAPSVYHHTRGNKLLQVNSSASGDGATLYNSCKGKSLGTRLNIAGSLIKDAVDFGYDTTYAQTFDFGWPIFWGKYNDDDSDWSAPHCVFFVKESNEKLSVWVVLPDGTHSVGRDGQYNQYKGTNAGGYANPTVAWQGIGHYGYSTGFKYPLKGWQVTGEIVSV